MNVKNFLGSNQLLNGITPTSGVNRAIKSESTHDRDANGQALFQEQKKKKKMTREQAVNAITILNAKHFMLDMKWTALLVDDNGFYYAEVVDQDQKQIRKISEFDLWELLEPQTTTETQKGNLLKRTA